MQSAVGNTIPAFEGLDQAAIDAAYNNSAAVANSPQILEDWANRSAVLRSGPRAVLDIRYGEGDKNLIDYFGCGARNAPLFIFIHGGYWQRNNKEIFGFVAAGPLASAINVATIGYTLAPDAGLTRIVGETMAAIDFLAARSDEFGFDARRVFVGGWSAGGHLAISAARHPAISGVVPISGIFDLAPIAHTYINKDLKLEPAEIETLGPIHNLPQRDVPIRLFVGGDELPELQRQSKAYAETGEGAGLDVALNIVPGCNHFTIMEEIASPNGVIAQSLNEMAKQG